MKAIEIINYNPLLRPDFERISKQWMEQFHLPMGNLDSNQLSNPELYILAKGGAILFAKEGEDILGTVGLVKSENDEIPVVYEMIKMGVKPAARGRGVGQLLGMAVLEKARQMGGNRVVLYSNSKMHAALGLYKKLGFREIPSSCSPCGRCNVKMEMDL